MNLNYNLDVYEKLRDDEQFIFFWHGPFSQWYLSDFDFLGQKFNCAEQFMMYCKALLFGDFETAEAIMLEKEPKEQKKLGRKVKNFDPVVWDSVCDDIVILGNWLKFNINPDLQFALMQTAGKTLVEASPYDTVWGIGLSADDPRALNRDTWLGQNRLGEAITKVRIKMFGE